MFWGREPLQGTRPSPWSREEGKGRFECGHRPGWGRGRRDGGRQSSAPTSVLEKIILKNYLPPFTVLKFSQSCKGRNFGTTVGCLFEDRIPEFSPLFKPGDSSPGADSGWVWVSPAWEEGGAEEAAEIRQVGEKARPQAGVREEGAGRGMYGPVS